MFDAAGLVLVICLLNLVPIAYDLTVSALLSRGYDVTRLKWFAGLTSAMDSVGFAGEYGLVGTVVAFILTAIYLHVTAFYPFFDQHSSWAPFISLHVLPSLLLNTGMLIPFYFACTRSPGSPDPATHGLHTLPSDVIARIAAKLGPLEDLPPRSLSKALAVFDIRFCGTCKLRKPVRTHHCSSCGICVADMDHHCPFTAQCVGRDNMRYFFPFMTHVIGATLYAMVLTYPSFHACYWALPGGTQAGEGHSHDPDAMHAADPRMDALCEVLGSRNRLLFLVASGCFLVLGSLFAYMVYLVLNGLTMIENMPFFSSERSHPPSIKNPKLRGYYAHESGVDGSNDDKLGKRPVFRRLSFYRTNLVHVFGPVSTWWRSFFPLAGLIADLLHL